MTLGLRNCSTNYFNSSYAHSYASLSTAQFFEGGTCRQRPLGATLSPGSPVALSSWMRAPLRSDGVTPVGPRDRALSEPAQEARDFRSLEGDPSPFAENAV